MPTYLCHGFRWQRRSIRVYTVVQDLDDVSPEWLIKPTSSRCLLQSFYNLFEFLPYCNPPPHGYESGSLDSEESEEDSEEGSDVEKGEEPKSASAQEKNERSQWPERLESLGVIRGLKEKEKGKGKSPAAEGKVVEDASSAITAIHVGGSESTSRTASRSPSLKLPLQGSRTSSKSGKTGSSTTTPTATTPTPTPTAPTSRSTSTLGVTSSARRKTKSSSRSRSSSHSPNHKKDELGAQRWSTVKVLEEYDPNNLDEVSRPYAYVADHVIRVDGAVDIMEEVKRYEERMQQKQHREEENTSGARKASEKRIDEKGGRGSPIKKNRLNRDSAGSHGTAGTLGRGDEEFHDALEHLTEEEQQIAKQEKEQTWIEQLRDELQRGEEIKWYVVVNGDEERSYSSNGFDDEDEEEDESEDEDYDEMALLPESNFNYGTSSHETEDHLTTSSNFSPAARSPTEGGGESRSSPYLSQHSAAGSGTRSRTSSRGGGRSRSKSNSRSQSRSHSQTRDRHRNHSRQRLQHGKKIRRPKPTKEQRQHHAQYTLQQELFERNDLRASSAAAVTLATTSGTSSPTPTQTPTPTPVPTSAPAPGPNSPTVQSPTRMITGSTTATGRPPTAMRNMNTKAIIKEGAARRVMSEGGVHRQSSRGIPVVPRSPEIPIIMVTPTRMTFPRSPRAAEVRATGSGTGSADARTAGVGPEVGTVEARAGTAGDVGAAAEVRTGTPEVRTGTAGGRRVVSEQQQQQQQAQRWHEYQQPQQHTEYPTQQEQERQQHQQQYQQQPKPQQQPQQQQHQPPQPQQKPQPQTFYQPESRKPSVVGNAGSSMGIITTAPAAAVSSFSLDTTPSNTVVPGGHSSNTTSDPSPKKSNHPPLSFSFGTTFGNGHRDGNQSGTTSKRSSLTSLRAPSSWSCLNLSLGHGHKDGHKDKDGHNDSHNHPNTSAGEDSDSDTNQPARPSPSPPIAVQILHPHSSSYEPVSTLPPRPAPPPPASAAQRPGRPLTPPPPPSAIGLALSDSNYHHRVPTAPSSPVAIKISATPATPAPDSMSIMRPETQGQGEEEEEGAAAPPVVGQYSSKTMPTKRRGNHVRFGSRSRSSGSLRRLFQRTSGKEGWI